MCTNPGLGSLVQTNQSKHYEEKGCQKVANFESKHFSNVFNIMNMKMLFIFKELLHSIAEFWLNNLGSDFYLLIIYSFRHSKEIK